MSLDCIYNPPLPKWVEIGPEVCLFLFVISIVLMTVWVMIRKKTTENMSRIIFVVVFAIFVLSLLGFLFFLQDWFILPGIYGSREVLC